MRLVALVLVVLLSGCGLNIGFENDAAGFGGGSDRNYTNGVRFQCNVEIDEHGRARLIDMGDDERARPRTGEASEDGAEQDDVALTEGWREDAARDMEPWLDFFDLESTESHDATNPIVGLAVGQLMYTPNDLDVGDDGKKDGIIFNDRPYAGWLYVGMVRYEALEDKDEERRRDTQLLVELDLGVIGPPSLAEQTQDFVHELTDSTEAQGWDNQLDFEPGVILQVARRDRWAFTGDPDGYGADFITHASASAGNIRTMGEVAALARWGKNLPRDFGPALVETGILGTPDDKRHAWYLFGAVAGRYVARDIFLDGNSFSDDSHSVSKRHSVGETRVGGAVSRHGMTLSYARVRRSREFRDQRSPHVFGSLTFSWSKHF